MSASLSPSQYVAHCSPQTSAPDAPTKLSGGPESYAVCANTLCDRHVTDALASPSTGDRLRNQEWGKVSEQWWAADAAPPEEFKLSVVSGEPVRVTFAGELDIVSADDAWAALRDFAVPGRSMVIDLRDLTFIDCSGVRVIEQLTSRLGGAMLFLVNPRRAAHRLLSLTGTAQRPNVHVAQLVANQPNPRERTLASVR